MIRVLLARAPRRREAALAALGVRGVVRRLVDNPLVRDQLLASVDGAAPDVHLLSAWLVELWHRFGDGRAVLSERAAALAVARALRAHPERWPALAAIPDVDETAGVLVAAAASTDPSLWEAVRASSVRTILADDAIERLIPRLGHPALRPALAADWVVIDEPLGADERRAAAVLAVARASAAAGAQVILCASAGRDRGGREAGELLGWEEATDRSTRVFAATLVYRRALFSLVESGEAEVVVAGSDRLRIIEPWTEGEDEGERALSDAYADQRPYEGAGAVRIAQAADPATEVRWAAAQIAQLLDGGADPRDVWVAADPGRYGALLAATLTDHGIPHDARPPGATPLARAVRTVARAPEDRGELCALALECGLPWAREVRRWVRAAGRSTLTEWAKRSGVAAEAAEEAERALAALGAQLAPLREPGTPGQLGARLLEVLGALGLAGRDPSWGAVLTALDEVLRDAVLAGVGELSEIRPALEAALSRATFGEDPPVARVRVVPLDALAGTWPRHLFALGLVSGAFPAAGSPLVAALDRTASQRALRRARQLFAERLRAAEEVPEGLWLSWPATAGDRAQSPSVLLSELLDLGVPVTTVDAVEADPHSARARRVRGVQRGEPALAEDARQAAVHRARTGPLGPYDGILRRAPAPPRAISVSAMEAYIACPARYWYTYVLRVAPPDPSTPELEPRRRGTALHAILERFFRDRSLAPLSGDPERERARAQLLAAATVELDKLETEGGFDPLFQRYARTRWVAGLGDERPAGILRVWLDQEHDGPPLVPLAVEEPIEGLEWAGMRIRGVVDRIDRLVGGGHLVTDYKTGMPPSRTKVEAGLSLQPLVYSEGVGRRFGGPVASAFLSLARADRVRRTGFAGDSAALDAACAPNERRTAMVLGPAEREQRLLDAEARAQELVAGRFPPTRHRPDVAGCPTCPFRRICRVDHERHGATA